MVVLFLKKYYLLVAIASYMICAFIDKIAKKLTFLGIPVDDTFTFLEAHH